MWENPETRFSACEDETFLIPETWFCSSAQVGGCFSQFATFGFPSLPTPAQIDLQAVTNSKQFCNRALYLHFAVV